MEKLEWYISERGVKLKWVAAQLGITYMSLHNKLTGVHPFTADEAVKLRYLLGISEADFRYIFGD